MSDKIDTLDEPTWLRIDLMRRPRFIDAIADVVNPPRPGTSPGPLRPIHALR
jgi:hypothetical protein